MCLKLFCFSAYRNTEKASTPALLSFLSTCSSSGGESSMEALSRRVETVVVVVESVGLERSLQILSASCESSVCWVSREGGLWNGFGMIKFEALL